MTGPPDWQDAPDPCHLFIIAWNWVAEQGRDDSGLEAAPGPAFQAAAASAVVEDLAKDVVRKLRAAVVAHWPPAGVVGVARARVGIVLHAMRLIDSALAPAHPRTVLLPPSMPVPLPATWVVNAAEKRLVAGCLAETDDQLLIVRGPFARNARGPFEDAGFLLADQFACLTVVERKLKHDQSDVKITVCVVDQGVSRGVPPRPTRAGSEVITFVPLADRGDDLIAKVGKVGARKVIDVEKGPDYDPLPAFKAAVGDCRDSDIMIAPELTIDGGDVLRFSDELARAAGPRLTVTGSALSFVLGQEHPWNEAVVMNSTGAILWRHRKVWPYGMLRSTVASLNLSGLPKVDQLMERIASSDEVTVADVDGLGRCVVLICQDFMMEPLVPTLLRQFQPDWIIVPILDTGTNARRWPFQRAYDLSTQSQARFLVVSSLTMVRWLKKAPKLEPGIGVAVGPRVVAGQTMGKDGDRQYASITCESIGRRHGSVRWRGYGGWRQARLDV